MSNQTADQWAWATQAAALLDLLESDFCVSDHNAQLEAIRCELERAYQRGREDEARDRL